MSVGAEEKWLLYVMGRIRHTEGRGKYEILREKEKHREKRHREIGKRRM